MNKGSKKEKKEKKKAERGLCNHKSRVPNIIPLTKCFLKIGCGAQKSILETL